MDHSARPLDLRQHPAGGGSPSLFPERLRVLLFIEDAVIRIVCSETATHMGFRAEEASSISQARELIATGLIDIAVIQIPFEGALLLEFISEIHQLRPETPIVTIGMVSAV